jgi:hypothetical protein
MAVSPEHKTRNNHDYNQEKHVCVALENTWMNFYLYCEALFLHSNPASMVTCEAINNDRNK